MAHNILYTKYNAIQHKQNFSGFFSYSIFVCLPNEKLNEQFAMISVFFIYHENEQQFAIILFLSLSLFYISVYVFIFRSYKYSVSFEHFFSIVLFFSFLFPTREYLFCFQFIVPSNNIHDRAGFVIEWRKHSVIGFQFIFSLCVLPAVFVHGEISWILNCIMEHAPP